ncbi:MAG TPA: hypothetical protein VMW27_05695 [Thermoanaerobaculia bacterium]|nr:hypothetical protein [Thermoanaerobaculia bacterium]
MAQALRPFKAALLTLVAAVLLAAPHAAAQADLMLLKEDAPDPVSVGGLITYTISLINNGPEDAEDITWTDDIPTGTTFDSFASPPDWTCTTPAVGTTGTISCSAPLLGSEPASFTLAVQVDAGVQAGTVITNTAQITAVTQQDPNPGNESSTATTTVQDFADYSLSKTDSPDPVVAGTDLVYTLTVNSTGSSSITNVVLTDDPLPNEATFQSLVAPAGWTCSTPAVGDPGGSVVCSIPNMDPGSAVFMITVRVGASVPGGTVLLNSAFLSSTTPDQNSEDTAVSTETTVISPATLFATKSVSGLPAQAGSTVTYTVVLRNTSASNQGNNAGPEFTDILPSALTLTGATATAGTVNANLATNTVTWNGGLAAGGTVTITIQATVSASASAGQTITNQGTVSFDNNGDGVNESTDQTDDPSVAGVDNPTTFVVAADSVVEIPALDALGFAALVLLLAATGALLLRR